jgi:hypothetical protein
VATVANPPSGVGFEQHEEVVHKLPRAGLTTPGCFCISIKTLLGSYGRGVV